LTTERSFFDEEDEFFFVSNEEQNGSGDLLNATLKADCDFGRVFIYRISIYIIHHREQQEELRRRRRRNRTEEEKKHDEKHTSERADVRVRHGVWGCPVPSDQSKEQRSRC
tara:strand:- start:2413 stop:2745 length:333 start_codon:yes stop_codon:yes gene_type:complete